MTLKDAFDQLTTLQPACKIRVGWTFSNEYSSQEKETGCYHVSVDGRFFCSPQNGKNMQEVFESASQALPTLDEKRAAIQAEIDHATRKLRELEAT